jgi:hypothetical protein
MLAHELKLKQPAVTGVTAITAPVVVPIATRPISTGAR